MRIDAHVHLDSPSWVDPANPVFPRREKKNRRRALSAKRITPSVSLGPVKEDFLSFAGKIESVDKVAEIFVADMDGGGIDKAIIMGVDTDYTGRKTRILHWDKLKELARIRDKYPGRFLLFCGIDPRRGKEGVTLFEKSVKELGCVGLKLMPHWGYYPDDREICYPLYEQCVALNVPVTSNCSSIGSSHVAARYCHPLLWEQVAYDFPEMNICLAHGGVPYHYEYALGLAAMKPNIYMDLSDWQTTDPVQLELFLKIVRRALNGPARYKIMFASDWPVFRAIYDEKDWAALFTVNCRKFGFTFTEDELKLIFSENVQDYLDLTL